MVRRSTLQGLGLGKRACARAKAGSCTHFDARFRVQAHQQVVVVRSDLTSLKVPNSPERVHADTQVVENGFGRPHGRRSRIGRGWNRQLCRTLPAPWLAALNACARHASRTGGCHLLAPYLLGALGAGDLVPAAGLSLEGGRRQCAELAAVGRREWQHAHCTLVRPVARPSLRPAHRRLPMWVGYSVRPTQIYETTQQFIIMAIGWSVTWSLGASAKKVTEENIPPSTFGNRIAETITVHTTATHHPQSNKTSCARRNLCTSLNQHSSAIPSVGLLIAQPQAITRSPLLHYHVPSPQARVVRQTRRPPARTCTYQAARKRTAERSTLAPSPITRRPHSEAGS